MSDSETGPWTASDFGSHLRGALCPPPLWRLTNPWGAAGLRIELETESSLLRPLPPNHWMEGPEPVSLL